MTCTATVRDAGGAQLSTPTGKVRIATAAIGTFDHTTCTLKKTNSIAASCAVHFTPKRPGLITLRSSYGGDAKHAGSQDKFFTNVDEGKTELKLRCQPNPVRIGVKMTCPSPVRDAGGAQLSTPTGKVRIATVFFLTVRHPPSSPHFTYTTPVRCAVHFTPKRPGLITLRSSYSGDAKHTGSQDQFFTNVDEGKTESALKCQPNP